MQIWALFGLHFNCRAHYLLSMNCSEQIKNSILTFRISTYFHVNTHNILNETQSGVFYRLQRNFTWWFEQVKFILWKYCPLWHLQTEKHLRLDVIGICIQLPNTPKVNILTHPPNPQHLYLTLPPTLRPIIPPSSCLFCKNQVNPMIYIPVWMANILNIVYIGALVLRVNTPMLWPNRSK